MRIFYDNPWMNQAELKLNNLPYIENNRKLSKMEIIVLIKKERITITDKITFYDLDMNPIELDYYICPQSKKNLIRAESPILLVNNYLVYQSFTNAFKDKYCTDIPQTKRMKRLVSNKIKKAVKNFEENYPQNN